MPLPRSFALVACLSCVAAFCLLFALLLFAFCSSIRRIFRSPSVRPPFCLHLFVAVWLATFAMPPRRTRNSFESSLPVVSSSCATSTVTSSSTAASAPAQVSSSSTSASISPEFLASVIQAIQTPISAIIQQSLSAAVGAPSVSTQGLPAISVQGLSESSLVNRAAHLDAVGMHQPWSSTITSTAVGSLPLNASTTSTSPPVASQLHAVPGTSSFLVVPPFVSVFSSAGLPFSAPCSSTVYTLPTTVNSAFASRPIVSHTAVPSLAALPLQQPFVVGPGYSPVPYKVVSQITAGKFVNLEDLLAENIPPNEYEPQLWFDGRLVLSHTPKKPKRQISDITLWMEAFSIFYLILCSYFPHRWRDLTSYKLLILRTYRQFSGFCWLNYDRAFREHAAAVKLTDWSAMDVQLFNYHTAGAQVRTRPASANPVTSQAEASGSTTSKVICHSWNAGRCISYNPSCRFRHACSRCGGDHRATSCTSLPSTRPCSPDPEEPKRRKRH